MRGKKLGRLLGVVAAVALAIGATSQAAFAGGVHSQKTPPNVPGFNGSTIKLGVITPESGIASVVGKPLTEGNRVYWAGQERQGRRCRQVQGRPVHPGQPVHGGDRAPRLRLAQG